jgi:signal peptidase II
MKTLLITAFAAIGLDQLTKYLVKTTMKLYQSIPVIRNIFHITYIENSGISFGILGQNDNQLKRWALLAVVAVAIAAISAYWYRYRSKKFLYNFSCGLILGGAAGNFIDRLFIGRITDFLEFSYRSWHFAVFNVADSCVSVGVFLFVMFVLFTKEEKNAPDIA